MTEDIDILTADEAWRQWWEGGLIDESHVVIAAKLARLGERAKIAAWLKGKSDHAGSRVNELAEAIKAGEHLK